MDALGAHTTARGLAVGPDDALYLTATSGGPAGGVLARLDLATGELQLLQSGLGDPGYPAVDAAGRVVWPDRTSGRILVLARPGVAPVSLTDALRRPGAVAVEPSGRIAFTATPSPASAAAANAVGVIDGRRTTVLSAGEAGPSDIAAGAGGDLYWTGTAAGVIMHRFADGRTEVLASGLEAPTGLALAPDGRTLYFTEMPTPGRAADEGGRNTVSALDLATRQRRTLRRGVADAWDVAATADGRVYWTASATAGLVVSTMDDDDEGDDDNGDDDSDMPTAEAILTGSAEVPAVDTDAAGWVKFTLKLDDEDDDGDAEDGGSSSGSGVTVSAADRDEHEGGFRVRLGTRTAKSRGFSDHRDGLRYILQVKRIRDVVGAHVHLGAADVNGPVVAPLLPPPGREGYEYEIGKDKVMVKGVITPDDLTGPFEGDWDGFLAALNAGELYVNVHTESFPGGEVRGQVEPLGGTTPTNHPPDATITAPASDVEAQPGEEIAFAGTASDPDGDMVTVVWDFGDGSTSTDLIPGTHAYGSPGTYVVTLTATDSQGLSDPTPPTRTITVAEAGNQPPDGTITSPAGDPTIGEGETVSFAGTATDPDGDAVTVLWDFGDGSTSTDLAPGDHAYATAGVYTVTFTATDANGLSDPTPDSRTVTVTSPANDPPNGTIVQPAGNPTVDVGDPVAFAGTASDPDGDAVTVLWDFGDGSTSTDLAPGVHSYATAGTYTVTFTATDANGLSDPTPDSRTVTVQEPVNNPPNGTIVQPAGDPTIDAGDAVTFAGMVTDPDGDAFTVLWDFGDGVSSTALSPGPHTYVTAGTYTVTFTATDADGLSDPTPDSRTVTVNPVATAATFTEIQTTIFSPNCIGCHGGSNPVAGLNLTAGQSYGDLVNVPSTSNPSILRVNPGNPDNSYLVIQLENGHRSRPQSEIDMIRSWILAGAANN